MRLYDPGYLRECAHLGKPKVNPNVKSVLCQD